MDNIVLVINLITAIINLLTAAIMIVAIVKDH